MTPAPRPVAPLRLIVHTDTVLGVEVTISRCGNTFHAYCDVDDEVVVVEVPDASSESLRYAVASVLQ